MAWIYLYYSLNTTFIISRTIERNWDSDKIILFGRFSSLIIQSNQSFFGSRLI